MTIFGKLLFKYSGSQYVFIYFITFFLASISFGIFVSTLFNKAKTASVMGFEFTYSMNIIMPKSLDHCYTSSVSLYTWGWNPAQIVELPSCWLVYIQVCYNIYLESLFDIHD